MLVLFVVVLVIVVVFILVVVFVVVVVVVNGACIVNLRGTKIFSSSFACFFRSSLVVRSQFALLPSS